jgi:colanic acid/amylovoran biosynthesis protein
MNILVIGQCSLHWGRMEFGNVGNYYIIEPFFRELHRNFPGAEIRTTMQMSQRFCENERVVVVPMELYYGWRVNELELAKAELAQSENWKKNGKLAQATPYLEAVQWADLIIDFSGDIWGDNANFLGADRFEVGMIKDLIAQNFGKRVVMLAGSPGPFTNQHTQALAQQVYAGFDLVTNREPVSTQLLAEQGFDVGKTVTLACPAFLFEPAKGPEIDTILKQEGLSRNERAKPLVGFILCGWNFEIGPFDKWPRDDSDYIKFAENIEYLTEQLGARVCLMSHSNGFDIPPAPFKLKHGRDYPVSKQLQHVLVSRGIAKDVFALDGIYDTWQTKAIVGSFDMLVSGRIHAAVAGLSQSVPTVVIDYGHEPKAHKLLGFATVAGVREYVADPSNGDDLKTKITQCWNNCSQIREMLDKHIPQVKERARQNFSKLQELV